MIWGRQKNFDIALLGKTNDFAVKFNLNAFEVRGKYFMILTFES